MSIETLKTPRRARCVDAESSFGALVPGVIYNVTHVWKHASDGSEMLALAELSGWWNASRFAVENNESTTDTIDCSYEEAPTLRDVNLPRVNKELVFDFDRYNSLAALPGTRR